MHVVPLKICFACKIAFTYLQETNGFAESYKMQPDKCPHSWPITIKHHLSE